MQSEETSDISNTIEPSVEPSVETGVDAELITTDVIVECDTELEQVDESAHVVIDVVEEGPSHGQYIGQCKWFNDLLGYGFLTICVGAESGKDIFVHHTGIKPLNSNYRTLKKGEYLSFNIVSGVNGLQATDVTGINGGPLMCDFVSTTRRPRVVSNMPPTAPQGHNNHQQYQGSNVGHYATFNPRYQRYAYNSQPHSSQQTRHASNTNMRPESWYVVTKTGRRKNLAKYSKEGRMAMKASTDV
jgi:CspA family cold shock protein